MTVLAVPQLSVSSVQIYNLVGRYYKIQGTYSYTSPVPVKWCRFFLQSTNDARTTFSQIAKPVSEHEGRFTFPSVKVPDQAFLTGKVTFAVLTEAGNYYFASHAIVGNH
jgi:hypothetical protein